ncbi:MAG: DUF6273 domain-containing protein [Clostridiales bacterium]|nr:DUF6273 domain-containing protein [Clostridiales bacterium]
MSKKLLSVLMCLAMLAGVLAAGGTFAFAGDTYNVGDTLYYGSYPQTDVTATLGSTLNSIGGTWTNADYGTSVNMRYKDVNYNGEKYRGVIFDAYRAIFGKGAGGGFQQDNGYIKGNIYWFKYEPLRWRVLDPSTGFILCDTAIDSQPFNYSSSESGSYYASNYAQSDIRAWLNADFYNTAFSEAEKSKIKTTALENTSAFSSDYDSASTNDKIFLLSWDEAKNSAYGFSSDPDTLDVVKRIKGTDYAKSQGLWYCKDGPYKNYAHWNLRTPWTTIFNCIVDYSGRMLEANVVNQTDIGICPAMKIQGMTAAAGLKSIAVKTMPTKTTYNLGEALNTAGLTLTATYSDGSTKTVTSGFTCTGFSSSTMGTKTVTVTYGGKTTTFYVKVIDSSKPAVDIRNFTANTTVDYKATVTFTAEVTNPVSGAAVHWFIDGKDEGTGDTYTVTKAKKSYNVQIRYIKDGSLLAESEIETVNVKTGFFAKLAAFFRSIFGKLPKIVQGYFDAELIDR